MAHDRLRGGITTANATPTTLLTIPLAAGKAYVAHAIIVARKGDINSAWFIGTGGASRSTGGVVTLTGASNGFSGAALDSPSMDGLAASWAVSGNNLLLQVTGQAATNITWEALVTVIDV